MKKIIIFFFAFSILFLNSCKNQKNVTFFIVNNSKFLNSVNIEAIIDTTQVLKQDFIYSGVTPDYKTFVEPYREGIYRLQVKADNIIKEDTFSLNNDIYIYISYDAIIKENGDTSRGLNIHKTYIKHKQY